LELVLIYFHRQQGPIAFHAVPKEVDDQTANVLGKLLDISEGEGFFEHDTKVGKEHLSCANYSFEIDSPWARGNKDAAMFSLIVDADQKPEIFEATLEKFATEFKNAEDIYKGFYTRTDKTDKDIPQQNQKIQDLVNDCYEECRRLPEAQKPGKIMILGLQAVGKTSIINQLTANKFDPKIKPTLGMQIIKSVIDNFKFNVYDLGGQEKIRKDWYNKNIIPDAIIFVIDVSAGEKLQDEAKEEFNRMISNFFTKGSEQELPEDTPILILGNKKDLKENISTKKIEEFLKPSENLNYRVGVCSALKNEGLEEAFKWLVKSFLFV